MEAVLVDRNFEFMPSTMANYVRATIGIVCDTEEELQFVISNLQAMDVKAEHMKHQIAVNKSKNKPKLRLKDEVDEEVEKNIEDNMNSISSLEID